MLVEYDKVYNPHENVTQFPIVVQTQSVPVLVKSPTAEPSNRFYLGSYEVFKTSWVKSIVAEDSMGTQAKFVNGFRIMQLTHMKQMFITLIDYNNNLIVDHLPLAALAPVNSSGAANAVVGQYFRTHFYIDPEASYVSWSDFSDIGGSSILMLTFYLQSKLKK